MSTHYVALRPSWTSEAWRPIHALQRVAESWSVYITGLLHVIQNKTQLTTDRKQKRNNNSCLASTFGLPSGLTYSQHTELLLVHVHRPQRTFTTLLTQLMYECVLMLS